MIAIPLEKARAEINAVFEQDFFNSYGDYHSQPFLDCGESGFPLGLLVVWRYIAIYVPLTLSCETSLLRAD